MKEEIITLKKILKILRNIFIVILTFLIIISIVGQGRKYLEKDDVKPLCTLVEVDSKKMHVYSQGEGEKISVLIYKSRRDWKRNSRVFR